MARASLSTALRTEVTGLDLRVASLLKIDFAAGAVLCATGNGPITYDSDTYQPNGLWLGASGVEERTGKAPAASLTMAVAGDIKTRIEAGGYRRTAVEIYQAILDDDYQLIDAFPVGSFRISTVTLNRSPDTFVYQIECGSDLEDAYRAHPVYPSNNMQHVRYANDTWFTGSSANIELEFEWGGQFYSLGSAAYMGGPTDVAYGGGAFSGSGMPPRIPYTVRVSHD